MPPTIPLLNLPFLAELTTQRRDIHAHPELAFNENRTADLVAAELERYGLEVHRGIAKTGVVGVLRAGTSQRMIGLRADMDALPLAELNEFPHHSRYQGKMHACGHDGHTAILLGAARYLAGNPDFDGIAVFIFQPAEESEGGAAVMIEDGLFERFPVESVYGLHNWPGIPVGEIAVMPGPVMAGTCAFEIFVRGHGCHAAMPHQGVDSIVAGAQLVQALQIGLHTVFLQTGVDAEVVVGVVHHLVDAHRERIARLLVHHTPPLDDALRLVILVELFNGE